MHDDYVSIFIEMKRRANEDGSLVDLLSFVDERRHTTLSTRHQLRAFISNYGERTSLQRRQLPAFENSILSILEGAFEVAHSLGHFRSHLMNQIQVEEDNAKKFGKTKPSRKLFQKTFSEEIDRQQLFLEKHFKVIAQEFAAMSGNRSQPFRLKRRG